MQFFILVLLFCFSIFLFALYRLSQDDFFFIRKAVSMEVIFNTAFTVAIISLIVARIFYIFSFPKPVFFTFLGSILFPYFPGLSIVGCVFGGGAFLSLYCLYKKIPIGRMLDFFSLSFLFALPVGFLFVYLVSGKSGHILASLIFYVVFLFVNIFTLLPLSTKGKIKDGVLGLIFLTVFSLLTIIVNIFAAKLKFVYTLENLILIPGLIVSLSLFIYKQFIAKKNY